MKIGPRFYDSLKGMDLAAIEELEVGPRGFQKEHGFGIVEGEEGEDGTKLPAVVIIPVFAVLCASDAHPEPQYRYVSPYELARGRVEIADRIHAVRIDVADQDLSELVVGRSDDIAEELKDNAEGFARSLLDRLARFVVSAAAGPLRRVAGFGFRLPGLIRGALERV